MPEHKTMLRVQPVKGNSVTGTINHQNTTLRTASKKRNIDRQRTKFNVTSRGNENMSITLNDYLVKHSLTPKPAFDLSNDKQRQKWSAQIGKALIDNNALARREATANIMAEFIIQPPKNWLNENAPNWKAGVITPRLNEYMTEAQRFIEEAHGENFIQMNWHFDEETLHAHAFVVPMEVRTTKTRYIPKGSNAPEHQHRNIINYTPHFSDDKAVTDKARIEKNADTATKFGRLQTAFHEHMSLKFPEIKRGTRNSKSKNKSHHEHHKENDAIKARQEETIRQIELDNQSRIDRMAYMNALTEETNILGKKTGFYKLSVTEIEKIRQQDAELLSLVPSVIASIKELTEEVLDSRNARTQAAVLQQELANLSAVNAERLAFFDLFQIASTDKERNKLVREMKMDTLTKTFLPEEYWDIDATYKRALKYNIRLEPPRNSLDICIMYSTILRETHVTASTAIADVVNRELSPSQEPNFYAAIASSGTAFIAGVLGNKLTSNIKECAVAKENVKAWRIARAQKEQDKIESEQALQRKADEDAKAKIRQQETVRREAEADFMAAAAKQEQEQKDKTAAERAERTEAAKAAAPTTAPTPTKKPRGIRLR